MAKPRKPRHSTDRRRRAETTLAAAVPAAGTAPAHEAGSGAVLALQADLPDIGRVNFSAPRAAQLVLTAAMQRAREADALRGRMIRNRQSALTPAGRQHLLRDRELFPFLQAAMAAVILAFTALDNFTTETIPSDFSIAHPKTGRQLGRDAVEGTGLELRLSAVMATLTGRNNLMSAEPDLWAKCMRLKERREALGHLKASQAFTPASMDAPDEVPSTIWADLLSILSYEEEVVQVVQDAMDHYGDVDGFAESRPPAGPTGADHPPSGS